MRIAVYRRVSTDHQDTESQNHAVQQWLQRHGHAADSVLFFEDLGLSGKRDDRPGLVALREAVDSGLVDTVVVYRLDRLSRNAITALRLLLDWMHQGVAFFAVDQPILQLGTDNPLRLTVTAMLSEFAQLEREALVSRVKSGLAAAKARGVQLGAPRKLSKRELRAMREARQTGVSYRELAQEYGVSHTTAQRLCREG